MQCRMAGLPEASARSKAGANSSVRSTARQTPKVSSKRGEVRILQARCRDASRIVALLMHADGAVHAVVEHHQSPRVVLHGGREFLPFIRKSPSPAKRRRCDPETAALPARRRRAVAHGARGRRELGERIAEAVVAMNPGGEVAGSIANDRVGGSRSRSQMIASPYWKAPGSYWSLGPCRYSAWAAAASAALLSLADRKARDGCREWSRRCLDGQGRLVHASKFFGGGRRERASARGVGISISE